MDLIGGDEIAFENDDDFGAGLGAPDHEALERAALEAQQEKEKAEDLARKAE